MEMKKKAKVDSKASLSIDNPCPIFRKLKKPKVDNFRRSDKVQRQHNICIYVCHEYGCHITRK